MTDAERRKKRNDELLLRVKNGESTVLIDATATWWPPREIIKKDKKEMERLYER
jgi:hypothetical protein